MISVSHLQKAISQNTVLAIDTLEVSTGEVAGVVGPPGSGKTTLLEILAGRTRPTAGEARVAGLDVAHEAARLRRLVGVLFADNAVYTRQSARANLDFQRRLYGLPSRRVAEALDLVGLSDCSDLAAERLPYGFQRRLALARAVIHDPRVLLLDEPFANVEEASAEVITRVLDGFGKKGAAVLVMASEASWLNSLCRRIYELDRGRIANSYVPDEQRREAPYFKIPAQQADRVVLLNPADILYVRSEAGQTLLRTVEGEVACRFSLAELEGRLSARGFFRAHRAYLVNLQRVKEIVPYTRDSFTLVLDDGADTEIPLSKNSAKELQSLLGY